MKAHFLILFSVALSSLYTQAQITLIPKDSVFCQVQEMPLFPGCSYSDLSEDEKTNCSNNNLLQFIYQNIKYPIKARRNGIEGIVVVSFIIEKNGEVSMPTVFLNPGGGLSEEALRVVKLMQKRRIIWRPGYKDDKPVRVQFNLPIRFQLE